RILEANGLDRFEYELRFFTDPHGVLDLRKRLTDDWDPYWSHDAISRFVTFYKKFLQFNLYAYHRTRLNTLPKTENIKILDGFLKELRVIPEKRMWIGNSNYLLRLLYAKKVSSVRKLFPNFYQCPTLSHKEFDEAFRSMWDKLTREYEAPYNVEHTPYNFLYPPGLKAVLPGSKFITLVRNPFDIISSYASKEWGSHDLNVNADQIISLFTKFLDSETEGLIIKMEDIVNDAEAINQRLTEYLGVSINVNESNLVSRSAANMNRSKEQVKNLDKGKVKILGSIAEKLGY
ncbi:MAG: sulfotransferase, partial [Cytophagales bacterium]|nr:sulfotransferase [Cytophagales bacterium]